MRGNRRDDFPVRAMWNALVAGWWDTRVLWREEKRHPDYGPSQPILVA